MERNADNEIILSEDDVQTLIDSGNLYFQHPVDLKKGLQPVKNKKDFVHYGTMHNYRSDGAFTEFFTYWDLKKNKPLFDVCVEKSIYANNITYTLSDSSLFGMFWYVDDRLAPSMKNLIEEMKYDVPDTDLVKYTENNLKLALLEKDFIKTKTKTKTKTKKKGK